jgi:epoxyqueuosine reductase QueG
METNIKACAQLKDKIIMLLKNGGAAGAGVADLNHAPQAMELHADPRLHRFCRAVSFFIPFPRSVIEELLDGPTHTYLHYYRAVNTCIDDLSLRLVSLFEVNGFEAFPIPSSQRVGKHSLDSIFPHRLAGYLAGLGWIGKSCCLVNEVFGPRLRLGTVLTNAPLPPNKPVEDRCGQCTACTKACPAGAIKGTAFAPDIPLSERLDSERCDRYQNAVRDRFGKRVCGLCLASCPFGRLHTGNSQ